jgi:hypothetical protein
MHEANMVRLRQAVTDGTLSRDLWEVLDGQARAIRQLTSDVRVLRGELDDQKRRRVAPPSSDADI